MKITFLISFFLSFILNYAQLNNDRKNDSLYRVWNDSSVHDTNRANALQAYVYNKFYRTNLDSAKLLSDLHIEIAKRSNGFRVQMVTPSQFNGTAQVMLSAACSSPNGRRLPTHVSLENTADVPSIFMPFSVTPSLSSAVTRSVGTVRPSL